MKREMLSIRDSVAGEYGSPIFVASLGVALRQLSDDLAPGGQAPDVMKTHAADYEIFHLGSFDSETGLFTLFDRPVSLGLVRSLVAQALKAVN